jgi:hypothetical protein
MLEDWQHDGAELRKLNLTNREKQYVLGTLLGTSSIIWAKNSKTPHLQMRESVNKEGSWLRCKAEELKKFSRPKSFILDNYSFRWNSIADYCWIDYYNLCYKDGVKKINIKWLDQLQDIGIAVWMIDKGQITNKNCYIRVSRLCNESIDTCIEYFNIIGIPCKYKKIGGSHTIFFEKDSYKKMIKLISPCFPAYLRNNIN